MANPTFVAITQDTTGPSGNPPAAIPGITSGDLIHAVLVSTGTITDPVSGYTTKSTFQDPNSGIWIWYGVRVSTGSDSFNPTYAGTGALYTWAYHGVDGTTPHEEPSPNGTLWQGTSASVSTPNITPTVNDSVLESIFIEGSGPQSVTTPPAGWTQILDNSAGGGRVAVFRLPLTGQGGTPQTGPTLVWSGVGYGPAYISAIRPPGGAAAQVTSINGIATSAITAIDGIAKTSISARNGKTI